MSASDRRKRHPHKISTCRAPTDPSDPGASFEAEYRKLLAYRSLADLQAIAAARGVDGSGDRAALIAALARRLSDVTDARAEVLRMDPPTQAILAYLHLTLTPGHALGAGNLLRELSTINEDGSIAWLRRGAGRRQVVPVSSEPVEPSGEWDIELENLARAPTPAGAPADMRLDLRQVYAQIALLTQRGLLLCFKQNSATYYSLPLAVRASLPVLSGLVPLCAANKVPLLQVQARSPAMLVQSLFDIWQAIHAATSDRDMHRGAVAQTVADAAASFAYTTGAPVSGAPFVRSDAPPRQPPEDEWPPLQGWDHLPSEIADVTRVRQWYVRAGLYAERKTLLSPLNQAVTVPAPGYRLRPTDRSFLRRKTGCADEEIEFYCALLEEIGALSTQPGRPIVAHPSAMQRLLSLPTADQVAAIGQAWLSTIAWSETEMVLRSPGGHERHAGAPPANEAPFRIRRSLSHADYKPVDLYQEWQAGRQAVFRLLSVMEEGQWFSVAGFLHTLFQFIPNLFHSSSAASVWWLESTGTHKQFGTTFDDWQQGYGRCLLAMLQGPLAWLGIVSLGVVDGQLEALRLTPAGQFLVGRRPTLDDPLDRAAAGAICAATCAATCAFGDDMTLAVAPNRVPPQLHRLLSAIGLLEQVTPQRFVYRLTPEGLRQWQESPQAPEPGAPDAHMETSTGPSSLVTLLQQHLRAVDPDIAVPAAWQDKLSQWSQNYGLLHVYEDITLVELADEYALQELLASTSLREHILYQFSPSLIAIRPDRVDDLVREMEGRGYTPRVV